MTTIPEDYRDLLADETQAFLTLSFTLKDGSPIAAPVWFVAEGDTIILNMEPHSLKARRMREQPQVAAVVMAQDNYVRYILVRGKAVERTDVDVTALWRRTVKKYEGHDPTKETDVTFFYLTPEKVSVFDYSDDEF